MNHQATFRVGDIECSLLSDGHGLYPIDWIFPSIPVEEAQALVGDELENGLLPLPYAALLVRVGGRTMLVDAGAGDMATVMGAPAGTLGESLAGTGVAPDDVDTVIISHVHPDHVGGLTRADGEGRVPAYGRARHWLWRGELQFWTDDTNLANLPPPMRIAAGRTLPLLADAGLIVATEGQEEVAPGVRLVPAPGHTPGHVVVALESRGEAAMFLGDAVLHWRQMAHPDWISRIDAIPELTVATRRRLLEDAASRGVVVASCHLGGPGRVRREGAAFRWEPLAPDVQPSRAD